MTYLLPEPTAGDFDIWIRTLWGECRGESLMGQLAVAHVIRTRAERASGHVRLQGRPHPLFGDGSITAVCRAPFQFSCWNGGDYTDRVASLPAHDPVYADLGLVAGAAASGIPGNPAPDATHYLVTGTPAQWLESARPVAVIGRHSFLIAN